MTTPAPGGLIALVDDEESLRETVAFALRREGHRVETFADGLEAWQSFEQGLPDLAIPAPPAARRPHRVRAVHRQGDRRGLED